MKRLTLILLLFATPLWATEYTEFYVTGTPTNNLNAGSTTSDGPVFHGTAGYFTNSTGWWKSSGAVDLSGLSVGMWASIYTNLCTSNVFVGRITNVSDADDTIAVSLAAKAGTAPSGDTDGFTEIRVGGAWRGPNTNGINAYDSTFPFAFVASSLTNETEDIPRFNFKGGTSYFYTNAANQLNTGPMAFEGYTNAVGDGGFAVFDTGVSLAYLTTTGPDCTWSNFKLIGGAGSGTTYGITVAGAETVFYRVIVTGGRYAGFNITGVGAVCIECEAYGNNTANSASQCGFLGSGYSIFIRCYSHDNVGTGTDGFYLGDGGAAYHCISESNSRHGINIGATVTATIQNCDIYNNGGSGVDFTFNHLRNFNVINCNIFKNTLTGITNSVASPLGKIGIIENNVFGSGTEANVKGDIGVDISGARVNGMIIRGSITYAANENPWTDAPNGNFTLKSTATTLASGVGYFLQSQINSPTNTVSFPDIGAAQRASTNAGASSSIRRAIFSQ